MRLWFSRGWSVLGGALFSLILAGFYMSLQPKSAAFDKQQSPPVVIPITIPINTTPPAGAVSLSTISNPAKAIGVGPVVATAGPTDLFGIDINQLLALTNQQRGQLGEGALEMNAKLAAAAQNKCQDMVSKDYWAHNAPDGTTPWSFDIAQGYSYKKLAENLATGFTSASSVMNAWMASPEHRANLLDPVLSQVGFGVCKSDSYVGNNNLPAIIVVEHLGEPL